MKHIYHLLCCVVILTYSKASKFQSNRQHTTLNPWYLRDWKYCSGFMDSVQIFFFSKKAVWKKGSKIQNTYFKKSVETESQRQEWPRELSSFPLLNPENISWGKEVFKFSYQPMGGWGDFQDTDIQLKYLIIKVTYFPCYSFHHTYISLVLIHGIVIINVSNY